MKTFAEMAPPRPPLPYGDGAPMRPPPPETDDEDDVFKHAPSASQPIMVHDIDEIIFQMNTRI